MIVNGKLQKEIFKTSSDIHSCTYETAYHVGHLLGVADGKLVRVVDTPGLNESMKTDSEHIVNMIRVLQEQVGKVRMFIFTVNGQEPRFDQSTRILLQTFSDSLGSDFWNHVCVVYTRWPMHKS